MSDPAISTLASLIERGTGIAIPPERYSHLLRRVSPVVTRLGYESLESVVRAANASALPPDHLRAMVATITVGETRFFRDPEAIAIVRKAVTVQVASGARKVTAWSAACATGAEAYTLAILLAELVPGARARAAGHDAPVLATDINADFIAAAERGRFSRRSVSNVSQEQLARWFTDDGDYVKVDDELRSMVSFREINLFSDPFPRPPNGFQIVFCANVLIYLTPATAVSVLERIAGTLAPEGILVVGAAESFLASAAGYGRVDPACCQVVRRREPGQDRERARSGATPGARRAATTTRGDWARRRPAAAGPARPDRNRATQGDACETPPATPSPPAASAATVAAPADPAMLSLARAAVLDEEGEAGRAKEELRRALYLKPDLAGAHFLLATIFDREGRTREARSRFRAVAETLASVPDDEVVDPIHGIRASDMRAMVDAVIAERGRRGRR